MTQNRSWMDDFASNMAHLNANAVTPPSGLAIAFTGLLIALHAKDVLSTEEFEFMRRIWREMDAVQASSPGGGSN